MTVTDRIIATGLYAKHPEASPGNHGFSMFDSGSAEIEVGEFLHALVRLIKPDRILETGTYHGVASSYMAAALEENNKGAVVTVERSPQRIQSAATLHTALGIRHRVIQVQSDSLKFRESACYDLALLDSEPHFRFDEFVRFIPQVRPGGFILIHDLHGHLGHNDQIVNGMYDWPYGDFRATLGQYIRTHEVQTITFPSPRGLTMFQKAATEFNATALLKGLLQNPYD